MLTLAQAKAQRRAIAKEIDRDLRAKDRQKLAELRQKIRDLSGRRKRTIGRAVNLCRMHRKAVREHAKLLRAKALADVRAQVAAEMLAARKACTARKAKVHAAGKSSKASRKEALRQEKLFQRQIRAAEGRLRKTEKATLRARLEENDSEVRRNIPEDLHALWNRVRGGIKGSPRRSRTEAFLEYVEEHPHEVAEVHEELAAKYLAQLLREQRELERAMRHPRRYKATPEELAAIPF